jgi:pimeloyl-ACP methyl ester carboxylesterase
MARTTLSGWRMLRHLRQAGLATETFGYAVSRQSVADIQALLTARVGLLAGRGDYILIGHSLGGVLLRAAVANLPAGTRRPRHLFLLGSPVGPSRFARWLRNNPVFRALTRDAGDLLGSPERMARIGPASGPTTAIVGTWGFPRALSPFGDEVNDCIVALSEVSADWLPDQVLIRVSHTVLPASRRVARIVLQRLDWPD